MISFVRGTLNLVMQDRVEIDTGTFGLEIYVPASVHGTLPPVGSDVTLYTYLNVREDDMSLFGFPSRDALMMFRELISVNGIGPKGALGILSALSDYITEAQAAAAISGYMPEKIQARNIGAVKLAREAVQK